MNTGRAPVIKRLPAILDQAHGQAFLQEVEPLLKADRSQIVLDFAEVQQLHESGVVMLLSCMEEVMKGNGDLKLAAVPAASAVILELTGVHSLFEIFDTASDAAQSFQQLPSHPFEMMGVSL
jgi:anti-anti-sigma factor